MFSEMHLFHYRHGYSSTENCRTRVGEEPAVSIQFSQRMFASLISKRTGNVASFGVINISFNGLQNRRFI